MIHCERVRQSTTHKLHICGSTGICCESFLVEGTSHPTEKKSKTLWHKNSCRYCKISRISIQLACKFLSIINRPPNCTKTKPRDLVKFTIPNFWHRESLYLHRQHKIETCCITFPVDLLVQKPAWRIIRGWSKRLGWPPKLQGRPFGRGTSRSLGDFMIAIFINHLQVLGWSC